MAVLPRPLGREDRGPEMWIDEAIWGHRLHDEQTPWLTFLEFLGVLYAEHKRGRALTEAQPNQLSYLPQDQLRLRNILFNNPHIATVVAEGRTEDAKWSEWIRGMAETSGGLETADFSYLREHFETFQDFASVVAFLQASAIEGGSNKRWSSKFVFPLSPAALYEDLNVASSSVSIDRRFFARTGEILYLMLCRSARATELRDALAGRLLSTDGPYDQLILGLQGETQFANQERAGAYVPLISHPAFDRMAEDWLALLKCPIPTYDVIPHLVTITGLNLVLYQLERAQETVGLGEPVRLVCEIVSPKRTVVRELSAESFQLNNALPAQAVERHIRGIEGTPEWRSGLQSEDPGEAAANILAEVYDWPDLDERAEVNKAPKDLLEALVARALVRHKQHVGKVHNTWARLIGLSSRRSSRRVRYAPTDKLLKTLVICSVPQRQEFKAFLALLHDRYGIVVGDQQARSAIEKGEADQEDFSDNARRLEERLASLGLLQRFSDSCAYVINPFQPPVQQ